MPSKRKPKEPPAYPLRLGKDMRESEFQNAILTLRASSSIRWDYQIGDEGFCDGGFHNRGVGLRQLGGFPDLTLVSEFGAVVFAELKSERGRKRLTPHKKSLHQTLELNFQSRLPLVESP